MWLEKIMLKRYCLKLSVNIVVGDKMQKTIIVSVETTYKHPKYGKFVKKRKKFYAHDEVEKTTVGDLVRIVETRPLSKLKRWRLVEILSKGK